MTLPITQLPGADVLPKKQEICKRFYASKPEIRNEGWNDCITELEDVGVEIVVEEIAKTLFLHKYPKLTWELASRVDKAFFMTIASAIVQNPKLLKLVKLEQKKG